MDLPMNITSVSASNRTEVATQLYQHGLTEVAVIIHSFFVYIIGAVGFIGNAILLTIIAKTKDFQTSPYILIANLAVTDLGILYVCMFQMAVNVITIYYYGKPFAEGHQLGCKLLGFVNDTVVGLGTLLLLAIAVNRYIAVLHIHSYKRVFTKRNTIIICISLWSLSAGLMIGPIAGWGEIGYDYNYYVCKYDERTSASYSYLLYARFAAAMLGLPYCYAMILRTKYKSRKSVRAADHKKGPKQDDGSNKLLLQFIIITSCFVIQSILHGSNNTLIAATGQGIPDVILYMTPLMTFNSTLNPIVYYTFNKQMRAIFFRYLKCCCPDIQPIASGSGNASTTDNSKRTTAA